MHTIKNKELASHYRKIMLTLLARHLYVVSTAVIIMYAQRFGGTAKYSAKNVLILEGTGTFTSFTALAGVLKTGIALWNPSPTLHSTYAHIIKIQFTIITVPLGLPVCSSINFMMGSNLLMCQVSQSTPLRMTAKYQYVSESHTEEVGVEFG